MRKFIPLIGLAFICACSTPPNNGPAYQICNTAGCGDNVAIAVVPK